MAIECSAVLNEADSRLESEATVDVDGYFGVLVPDQCTSTLGQYIWTESRAHDRIKEAEDP